MAGLNEYSWLAPLLPKLNNEQTAGAVAAQIRARDPELDAQLHTTISPTMLNAGMKINVIPNTAQGQLDIRRLPNETRQEVLARLRKIVNDPAVEITPAPGQEMPATEPSSLTTALYKKMEEVFHASSPNAEVVPYMQRGATDGSFLREKGMAVYGVPIFLREDRVSRAHGNDERLSIKSLEAGTKRLWDIVLAVSR
jgi:acetylornithine deacetylase/succinyl-diaminopimelate desuccinylase-like protein